MKKSDTFDNASPLASQRKESKAIRVAAVNGTEGQVGTGAAPWESAPYSLVSWWKMEKFSAAQFYRVLKFISIARDAFGQMPRDEELAGADGPLEALELLRTACSSIGLRISVKCVDALIASVTNNTLVGEVLDSLTQTEKTINWEMEDRLFMFIPPSRAERYDLAEPLGPEVAKSFPSCSFDAKESGNCFASGRFTATVFHLMRVLEIGLVAFAKQFPSVPTDKENWQQIIEKIESEIREMPKAKVKAPDWKTTQERYSQIANSFMFFKDAWRNYTAHARGKYTEDEADAIYRNVASFMKGLASQGISEM